MKKTIAIVIALLMVLTVFVSCTNDPNTNETGKNETNNNSSDVVESTDAPSETNTWGDIKTEHDVPDDLDYQGAVFGIACRPETRYRREISVEQPADPLDMQIFLRNQRTEKFLNAKFKFIESPDMWDGGSKGTSIPTFVKTEFEAGVQSDVDVIFGNAAYAVTPSIRGYTANLNGKSLPYLNINKLYWNQSYVDAATCYDQLYYIVGDLTLTIYDKAMVTFINFDKATAANITSDSIYALIEDGEWTIDKFLEIVEGYDYLDNNNNYTVDAGDDMRITTIKWSEAVDGYYASFDLKLLDTNTDESHTITIDGNTRLQVGTEKVAELYSLDGIFLGDTGSAFNMFINGYSLFHTDILYRNAEQNAQLRNASFNYGILPLPMYDTDQYDTEKDSLGYYTTSQDAYNAISVLKTHPEKLEMVSAFLEVLASDSYNNCRPYYVEKMIKGEYVIIETIKLNYV